jgi:SulP family sulfate permease
MTESRVEPKLVTVLREGYSRRLFAHDLGAGLVVGVLALPLALAFAIASGVKPEQGLYTAIVGGLIISVLGGSRVQIGGPTGAFVVIVYGVVARFGYDGLVMATMIAGVLLIMMGLARLGTVIKFIPYPVTVGFTAGIALIILSSQLRDFLGLAIDAVPADFLHKLKAFAPVIDTLNPFSIAVGLATVAIVLYAPRVVPRIPGPIIAIVATTALVHAAGFPVDTIGTRFGSVPDRLPVPHIPGFDLELIRNVLPAAFSIALLAGIESLLSAGVADGMTGRRHRSNTELIAQGVANLASPGFGGIPCTGAIARTATNVRSGARTPVAGIIHAVVLLLIMLLFGKWVTLVPMATLAGILVVISVRMSEWRLVGRIFRSTRSDALVMVTTFLLTVLVDLTVAIQVGVVLASFLFMKRMAEVTRTTYLGDITSEEEDDDAATVAEQRVPDGVAVFEVYGPFFFGAADKFKSTLNRVDRKPRVLILRMRHVPTIDATGLHALEDVHAKSVRDGTVLILSGMPPGVREVLRQAGFERRIGVENLVDGFDAAMARARGLLDVPGHGPDDHR